MSKIKELVAAGHALAKELHCAESAALVRELATQLDVQLARSNALAAENAGLKSYASDCASAVEHWNSWSDAEDKISTTPETPATDAFLAEVRASAIDSLVDIKTKQLADMHPDTHAFGATAMSIRSQINELQVFAAQIRKGVQS